MARLYSPSKINLGLFVLGQRPDGYHNLDTLFARLSLADTISIAPSDRLEVSCQPTGPSGAENLVYQALRRLEHLTGHPWPLRIEIEKRVPIGAGLGGGSANVATVLRWLVEHRKVPYELAHRVAREMGSDVPFFLEPTVWARGRGRGDLLEPLQDLPVGVPVLLVVPPFRVSTARAYEALAQTGRYTPPSEARKRMDALITALRQQQWQEAAEHLANDFEPVVFRWHPELRELKTHLQRSGAVLAGLSGSGSALFGVFPEGISEAPALPAGYQGIRTQIGPPEHDKGGGAGMVV